MLCEWPLLSPCRRSRHHVICCSPTFVKYLSRLNLLSHSKHSIDVTMRMSTCRILNHPPNHFSRVFFFFRGVSHPHLSCHNWVVFLSVSISPCHDLSFAESVSVYIYSIPSQNMGETRCSVISSFAKSVLNQATRLSGPWNGHQDNLCP